MRIVLRRVLVLILLVGAGLSLAIFQPWYHRSLTWRILATPSDSGPEFTRVLLERFPIGSSPEPAVRELQVNGFTCDSYKHSRGSSVYCRRRFPLFIAPVAPGWYVRITCDKESRIEQLSGKKEIDAI